MFESVLCQVTEYDPEILDSLIELAVKIAREGREGRRIGTSFSSEVCAAAFGCKTNGSAPACLTSISGPPLHLSN